MGRGVLGTAGVGSLPGPATATTDGRTRVERAESNPWAANSVLATHAAATAHAGLILINMHVYNGGGGDPRAGSGTATRQHTWYSRRANSPADSTPPPGVHRTAFQINASPETQKKSPHKFVNPV